MFIQATLQSILINMTMYQEANSATSVSGKEGQKNDDCSIRFNRETDFYS